MAAQTNFFAGFIDGSDRPGWSNVRILGRRLRKFSLWHCLLLRAMENPLVTKGGLVGMRDLCAAVAVCSLSFDTSKLRLPWLVPLLIRIRSSASAVASALRLAPRPSPNAVTPYQAALESALKAFVEYTGDYFAKPDLCVHQPKGAEESTTPRRGHLPPEIEHVSDLMANPGLCFPEQRAWDMPVSAANFYRPLCWRIRGVDVDFVTEEEEEFMKNLPPEYSTDYKPDASV